MMEGGFLAPRRPQPIKLGLVVAAHVAIVVVLMLAAAPKVIRPIAVFQGYNVDDPPPPPPHDRVEPLPRAATQDHVTVVQPEVTQPVEPAAQDVVISLTPSVDIPSGPELRLSPPSVPTAAPVLTDAEVDPRFAEALQPPYPPDLQRQGISGSVTVRVLVGPDGRVQDVQLVSADDPGFFAATKRRAQRAWRFRPATRDGMPIASWRTMTAHFVLQ